MDYERGDRVMAVNDLEPGWLSGPKVEKGTAGVVLEASDGGWGLFSGPSLVVSFENGEQLEVKLNDVQKF